MKKFKMMIGVNPGYGHENDGLTPEYVAEIGKSVAEFAIVKAQKVCKECNVSLASAVYPRDFGAPNGGELGVVVEGEFEENNEEKLMKAVQFMMGVLGQNTVTIEYSRDGKSLGSDYLSEGGKEVSHNESTNENIESFNVRIPKDKVKDGIVGLGSSLQEKIEETMKQARNDRYLVTGVITEGKSKDGVAYYEYSGTQNPAYGQENKEIYVASAIELIKAVVPEDAIIEFNDASVIVINDKDKKEISLKGIKESIETQKTI